MATVGNGTESDMGRIRAGSGRVEQYEVVVAATAGDQAAFTALAERYRWELQGHCCIEPECAGEAQQSGGSPS